MPAVVVVKPEHPLVPAHLLSPISPLIPLARFYMSFDFGANVCVRVRVCVCVNIAQNRKQQNYSYAT